MRRHLKDHIRLYTFLMVLGFFTLAGFAIWSSTNIRFDISADAVALKRDLQSPAYQKVIANFNDGEQLLLMIDATDPFKHVQAINKMVHDINGIHGVGHVYGITNVPLLFSPKLHLFELMFEIPTLNSPGTQLDLAKKELSESPFYRRLFLNKDHNLTSLLINLTPQKAYITSNNQRYARLNYLKTQRALTPIEQKQYQKAYKLDQSYKQARQAELKRIILGIEAVMEQYQHIGELHLLGIPTISKTIMDYLKADLFYFGWLSLAIMTVVLGLIFRRIGTAVLGLVTSVMVVVLTAGVVSILDWPLTIVSTNFPPILFVISLTFTIYLLLRFDEIHVENPKASPVTIIKKTVLALRTPVFYSGLTTVVGFLSLTLCNIQPIIDFGYIMSIGLPIAYGVCFLFLPAARYWLTWPKQTQHTQKLRTTLMHVIAYEKALLIGFGCLIAFFAWGCQYIQVENRFIDYFTYEDNMVKSIQLIDKELAGSSTLDILLEHPEKNHWTQPAGVTTLKELHGFLDKQPEINKVISIYTMTETLNMVHGEPLSPALLKFSLNGLNKKDQMVLIKPYLTNEGRLARVVVYLPDSNPHLRRDELLTKINQYLKAHVKSPTSFQVTGIYWLYNNVLQSLVNAQLNILITVYCLIGAMLLCLFRDIRLTCCALIPNVLPLSLVFGCLGWLNISLDFMTITIAAISLGLSIDFAIQFIYRMQQSGLTPKTFMQALTTAYDSIGYAILTTTLTLITGFTVMLFSHFKPLVYFSLLSGLSILTACMSTLFILPILLKYIYLKRPLECQ